MEKNSRTAVALGNFDGLHRGHMKVLQSTLLEAQKSGLSPVALLFDEHPVHYLTGKAPELLMTDSDRKQVLAQLGIKPVVLSFAKIRELDSERFVKEILVDTLGASVVCCGFNYHFAKDSSGNAETLRRLCEKHGIKTAVADEEEYENEPVSSTRIRRALLDGKPRLASAMLGRSFSYCLPVIHGDSRGRTIGFPTINQRFPEGLIVPKFGVYASAVTVDGESFCGVTNIGIRPTVGGNKLLSETHILSFSGDLYSKEVRVELLDYLRGEIGFDSFDSLKEQITADAKQARQVFEKQTGNNKY